MAKSRTPSASSHTPDALSGISFNTFELNSSLPTKEEDKPSINTFELNSSLPTKEEDKPSISSLPTKDNITPTTLQETPDEEYLPAIRFTDVLNVTSETTEDEIRANDLSILTSNLEMINAATVEAVTMRAPLDLRCKLALTSLALVRERQKVFHRVTKNDPGSGGGFGQF